MMSETTERQDGQVQIERLIRERLCGEFTEWEETFIGELRGKKYIDLTSRQKHVVSRLIGWLDGK